MSFFSKLFPSVSDKLIKKYSKELEKIKKLEPELEKKYKTIEQIQDRIKEFRQEFKDKNFDIEKKEDQAEIKTMLDKIQNEVFWLHRLACKLINNKKITIQDKEVVWNMVPYDVQLIWAMVLNDWNIAEMKTWEWKTLVATLSASLNAIAWFWVHVVTVNEYLAKRDAQEMSVIYNTLWFSVWVILSEHSPVTKKWIYALDITYVTNNELWFDYLRDNMAKSLEQTVLRPFFYALVDEADSIFIDEARTPLIISAPDNEPTSKYIKFAEIANRLENKKDYKIDEKAKTALLKDSWIRKLEKILWVDNIYASDRYNDIHHIENALKANFIYIRDIDYLVHDQEVMIIDEHTWRAMEWRRYSNWLHQAIEAKEKVEIQQESKTLASITFQNLFRLYPKLSWMTWTAVTQAEEFLSIYWLDVVIIPTNKPIVRDDRPDLLFKNEKWKFEYVVELVKEVHMLWQPILVWTVSVSKSEYLSEMFRRAWIRHTVLNAKNHKQEADIIKNAWKLWAVTIATNMAWRWTDIRLDENAIKAWWLMIIWTEKHETRRIDNQLRWRAWRQWDPWLTEFLVSPQDDIMRVFWWDKLYSLFNWPLMASVPDNEPLLNSKFLSKKIDWIQKQVEWYNFDSRKHVLEYDDVLNQHRLIIYWRRYKLLKDFATPDTTVQSDVKEIILEEAINILNIDWPNNPFEWDYETPVKNLDAFLNSDIKSKFNTKTVIKKENIISEIKNFIDNKFESLLSKIWEEKFNEILSSLYLHTIDKLWMTHMTNMSYLKEEVSFMGQAQKDPLLLYKEKAFTKFTDLLKEINFRLSKAVIEMTDEIEINLEREDSGVIISNKDNLNIWNAKIKNSENKDILELDDISKPWDLEDLNKSVESKKDNKNNKNNKKNNLKQDKKVQVIRV